MYAPNEEKKLEKKLVASTMGGPSMRAETASIWTSAALAIKLPLLSNFRVRTNWEAAVFVPELTMQLYGVDRSVPYFAEPGTKTVPLLVKLTSWSTLDFAQLEPKGKLRLPRTSRLC